MSIKTPMTAVLVVPTIALIDETRRRILKNLPTYTVISHRDQKRPCARSPVAYVLTQERLLERDDISEIDLLFIDEFYKLDPSRDDERFEPLNVALYKSIQKSNQIFMAGPHITSITLGPKWNGAFKFVQTDFRTVSVNIIDRSRSEEHFSVFLSDLKSVGEQASLVFTAHPGSAIDLANALLNEKVSYRTEKSELLSDWIARNYHPEWIQARAAREGIAAHHGRVPRSLAQLFVRAFHFGMIKVLICTSTLIEGVNTSAANVFLYDKKINRTDFDFFSFANIRGRVGRMMRHFVGNAFLYHQAPESAATNVDVPVLSDPSESSDYILLNVDEKDLSESAIHRSNELVKSTGLPKFILARYGSLGMERLLSANSAVENAALYTPDLLIWSSYPNKEQRIFFSEILFTTFIYPRQMQIGARAPPQLGWCLDQLSRSRSISSFIRWFVRMFKRDDSYDVVLDRRFNLFLPATSLSRT